MSSGKSCTVHLFLHHRVSFLKLILILRFSNVSRSGTSQFRDSAEKSVFLDMEQPQVEMVATGALNDTGICVLSLGVRSFAIVDALLLTINHLRWRRRSWTYQPADHQKFYANGE